MKIIVDANNLGFMAHYSTGELSIQNMRTGAIFGFMRMMFAISQRFNSREFIFCFDSRKSFRMKRYGAYKENRRVKVLTEEEKIELKAIRDQIKELRKFTLLEMGFRNILMVKGLEGDDIIASVVKQNKNEHFCVVSNDNDLFQLLSPNVFMYKQSMKERVTHKDFKEKYGIKPKKWALAKAIGGCNGDNVIGIKGAADPSNKPRSKALQYLRGELTKGVIFDRIESEDGQKIIRENLKLVKLPYKKTKIKIEEKEKLKRKKWIEVFGRYDFRFFLMPEQLTLISQLFKLK